MKMKRKRIFITGIGPLSSLGIGKNETWKNLIESRSNICLEKVLLDKEAISEFFIHKIRRFSVSELGLDAQKINEIKSWKKGNDVVDLNYFIAAIKLALDDAAIGDYYSSKEVGMVLGHENPGLNQSLFELFSDAYNLLCKQRISRGQFIKKIYNIGSRRVYDLQTFMFLYHISRIFNIHGFSLFINNACCSGLYALETASDVIRSGKCKAMIVSAVDSPDFYKYLWFREIGMHSDGKKILPFSKNANGFILGHGGAALLLEDEVSAVKRKAKIYAEYVNGSFFLESWKVTYPAIKEHFYKDLLSNLLKKSKIKPSQIQLITPHGVGNKIIDSYEASEILEVFKKAESSVLMTAFKPYIGHTLGASALLETILLIMSMEKNLVVPVLEKNISNLIPSVSFTDEFKHVKIKLAVKTCTGFAGFDGAVILKNMVDRK